MQLPVTPPVAPMLAKAAKALPAGDFLYEPKWDGFRCIAFRSDASVELGSRNERPLTRYFPDVVEAVLASFPSHAVIDGEVVVAGPNGLDFDALGQRIHPADSRVRLLAASTPASFVAFDILALGSSDLRTLPFARRRELLEEALASAAPPVHLTPITRSLEVADDWFHRFEGAGLDGVVAKAASLQYRSDERVMVKVKHERTAEFVVGGLRWFKGATDAVGSLMLGLYRDDVLHNVGVIGSFPLARRRSLVDELQPYVASVDDHPWGQWADPHPDGQRLPGAVSRWNAKKDLSFVPLRPELVVEAAFEHLQGDRLRHTAQFRRWRPDRDARSCTYDQVDVAVPTLLADVFSS